METHLADLYLQKTHSPLFYNSHCVKCPCGVMLHSHGIRQTVGGGLDVILVDERW